jgi:hypothetical protein
MILDCGRRPQIDRDLARFYSRRPFLRSTNHSFRATWITAYLKNGGTLEKAASWRTTPVPAPRSFTIAAPIRLPSMRSSAWGFNPEISLLPKPEILLPGHDGDLLTRVPSQFKNSLTLLAYFKSEAPMVGLEAPFRGPQEEFHLSYQKMLLPVLPSRLMATRLCRADAAGDQFDRVVCRKDGAFLPAW